MPNLFERVGGRQDGVFADETALLPEYSPPEVLHREKQLQEIAACLKPASEGKTPENLFIHGGTGTGKTCSVKHVLSELVEYSEKAFPICINCWNNYSRQAILSLVADAVGEPMPRRGIAADEVFSRIVQALRREKRAAVIALDEADRLFFKGEEKVLYDFVRANENEGVKIGVILVSNDKQLLLKLDDRVRSSLHHHEIEFPKYSPPELKDILRQRAKKAFFPNACSEDAIALAAAHAAKLGGDCRIALETLWKAGKNCEKRGSEKISLADVKASFEAAGTWKKELRKESLSEGEELVLELLKNGPLTSGELYEKFVRKRDETDRTVRNYVNLLEQKKLVATEPFDEGTRGKTRKVSLA